MKIISWNLLHRGGASVGDVAHLIRAEKPDLMLMQETTERIDELPNLLGGHYARDPLPGRAHGLAAWSPLPFHEAPAALMLQPGMLVRRVCQIIRFGPIGIANVHLSHGQMLNRRQLRRIARMLPPHAAIFGDCNLVGPAFLPGFHDLGPDGATHNMAGLVPLRLDRCFLRHLQCREARLLPGAGSDHRPILVRLDTRELGIG